VCRPALLGLTTKGGKIDVENLSNVQCFENDQAEKLESQKRKKIEVKQRYGGGRTRKGNYYSELTKSKSRRFPLQYWGRILPTVYLLPLWKATTSN